MSRSTSPASNGSPRSIQRVYAPIRRIARACINCRRKKARCPGEMPECSTCKRLLQPCSYPSSSEQGSKRTSHSRINQSVTEQMVAGLEKLEQSLTKIDEKVERILAMPGDFYLNADPYNVPLPLAGIEPSPNPSDPLSSLFSLMRPSNQIQPLRPYNEQLILVDLYFSHFHNQPYSLFHESDFRIRFHTGNIPGYLVLAVMVNSFRFMSDSSSSKERLETAATFADSAWQVISNNCFSGNGAVDLSIIQALTLLCIFDFTTGHTRHNSAWVKIGIAVRLAQDSRLTEEANASLSASEKEERRRVFWSLYLLERLVSCGRCRPPAILDRTCSLRLPSDEDAWYNHMDQPTPTLDAVQAHHFGQQQQQQQQQQLSTFGAVIVSASLLSQCAQYMLHKQHIGHGNVPWHPQSQHAVLISSIMQLESQLAISQPIEEALQARCYGSGILDQSISSHLVFSRLLFHLCQCLAYHPFLLCEQMLVTQIQPPKSFWNQVKQMSQNASYDMIDSIRRSKQAGCMLTSSFSGYCVTVAATIQALHHSTETPCEHLAEKTWFQQCNNHLERLGIHWRSSITMKSKLKELDRNIHKYSCILDGDACRLNLDDHDRELMWSLIDYSTISRQTPEMHTKSDVSYT